MSKTLGRSVAAGAAGGRASGDTAADAAARIPRWTAPGAGAPPAVPAADIVLPPRLTARLQAVAEESAAPLDAVLLAAHLRVVAALTSRQEPVTGYVPAGGDPAAPHPVGASGVLRTTWRELIGQAGQGCRPPGTEGGPGGGIPPRPESVLDLSDTDPAEAPEDTPALWVRIAVHAGGVVVTARSRSDVMTDDQLTRIVGYHGRALELLAAHPDAPAGERSLLAEDERHFQIYGLAGPAEPSDGRLFVERFEEQVRRTPDAVAVTHRSRTWTYRRLDAHAQRIAHALRADGLADEDVVAVVMERGLEWAAATLGVFKAGGCYLPVQPDFPPARIAAQLDGVDCRFVLGAGPTAPPAPDGAGRRRTLDAAALCADDPAAGGGVRPATDTTAAPGRRTAPDRLAYIYFTSGSTGTPKGVMCEHAGLLNHLLMKVTDLGIGPGAVVAQTAAQSLDISLWQLVAPLLTGGSARIVDTDVLLDVDRFLTELTAARATVVQLVPSYFDALITALERHPRDLGALRVVSVTGEELKRDLVRRWFACRPDIRLVNAYGATEVSDDTMHEILDRVPDRGFVTLGRMRRNVRGYVLDEQGGLAPLGATGEIVFSGVAVGRGYVNDPERTRAAFVPDPFRPGQRMYRTGDFGRWLPEGRLQFLGRRDQQVKIRGYRIETGEVENGLLAVDGVKDAVVVASAGSDRHKVLVAFLVGTGRPDTGRLRDVLAGHLPDYLIPTYCHWLDALPVSENGKVDRKALTELAGTLGHADATGAAPATPTEQRLAMAWAEALNAPLQCIGRTDNFFALGGTSLSATWLVVKLDRLVSLARIVAHPVLADLAAVIDAGDGTAPDDTAAPLLRSLTVALPDRTAPAGRLVCFPGAGGNAVNFLALARELAPCGVEVYGVELPGHDFVPGPQDLVDVAEAARRVHQELRRLPGAPLLLWGQGEGAAHALALARLLQDGPGAPRRVFVGGAAPGRAAGLPERMERVRAMSDQEVTAALLREGAYVEFDGLKPERARLMGPAYRHDVHSAGRFLLAAWQHPAAHRITAPLALVVAAGAPDGTPPGAHAHGDWQLLSDDVTHHELDSGRPHFLRTRAADAKELVLAALAAPTAPASPVPAPVPSRPAPPSL
ncbi:amino acid adenylation domain-containing protein [Streptomyces sp. NBC_01456]|uniref:non-ribosomal peptide synthetase family protein n=1 Tax=unclassified Streptomyces TaxID=2593676 RepID=UPI002E367412|nr:MULTISPECIES: amino acid adenylation domain-containing protein [unclassified Streptomyces]